MTWRGISGRPTGSPSLKSAVRGSSAAALMKRRKLILKAEVESSTSQFTFKRLVPGGFNVGLIGSTCTALP